MKTSRKLKVLTAALLVASCAQTQTKQGALNIHPLQRVQHGYDQAKAQYELGRYYHGQRRHQEAIAAYHQALAANPGMLDALNALGAAYAESGNLGLARQQFEAALKLQPESAYTYNNLGFVNYLAGDYPAAVEAYEQALRRDAGNEKARQNLVLAHGRMGKEEQVARTAVPATPVIAASPEEADRSQAPAEDASQGTQSAWVKVSPSIYEMHSAVVQAEQPAATQAVAVAGAATERQVAKAEAAQRPTFESPAAPVVTPRAVAQSAGTGPHVIRVAAKAATPAASVPEPMARAVSFLRGVEVSNGNGIRGLAARVARYFSRNGIQQARLTNQKPFAERRTRIEYRPGSEAEAARINKLLPQTVPAVASRSLRPDIRVRLVLGHDLQRNLVAWDSKLEAEMIAGLGGMELPSL